MTYASHLAENAAVTIRLKRNIPLLPLATPIHGVFLQDDL